MKTVKLLAIGLVVSIAACRSTRPQVTFIALPYWKDESKYGFDSSGALDTTVTWMESQKRLAAFQLDSNHFYQIDMGREERKRLKNLYK